MDSLNHSLFLALNASPGASGPVVWLAILFARYVIYLVPLHLVLVWVAGDRRMRAVALTALVSLLLAIVVNQAIGTVTYSPRPFVIGLGTTLIDHRPSSSLPSNHATIFFTYALVLLLSGRRGLALTVAGVGLVVCWSRIYLGVHYPLDMLAACLTALVCAFAGRALMARWGDAILGPCERLYWRALALARRPPPPRPRGP